MKPIRIILPIETLSPNRTAGEHWGTRARRARQQRSLIAMALEPRLPERLPKKLNILITRCGPRLLDPDNSIASLKATRDGVADALGIDDGSPRLDWLYGQCVQDEYAVEIRISA